MLFLNAKEDSQRKLVVRELVAESKTSGRFHFLLAISTIITCLGLILNNAAIVIGGMLITPLMTPLLALGLALTTASLEATLRSLVGIISSVTLIMFLSFLVGLISDSGSLITEEVLIRAEYSNLYLIVAFFSGLGATYAWIEHKVKSALSGVAVAVSLLPPLCVAGLAISHASTPILINSLRIFLANFLGITLASILIFAIFNFKKLKKYEEQKISKEDAV